ncbi:unnamed protein product [Withania somnifera]
MENNSTKVEMMKPVFLKAGIPIAITLAGYIIAKITRRSKISNFQISSIQENPHHDDDEVGNYQNLENSESLSCIEDDDHCSMNTLYIDSSQSFDIYQENPHEVSRNEDGHQVDDNDHCSTHTLYRDSLESFDLYQEKCKTREDIMSKFEQYAHLKDQEISLMDMQSKLLLEINKVDYFINEITLMEGENQRFQNMVIEYLRIMELVDLSKSENSLLHKKVKKLLKKIKESSSVIKEQKFQLEVKDKEISRYQEGIEMKDHVIKKMELEIQQLKMAIEHLQMEKAETSNLLKNEVVNGLEQFQKDKASEDNELIYLRWCNACLRHELMRRSQEQMEQNREIVEEFVPKVDEIIMRSASIRHNESCLNSPSNGGHLNDHSKKRKLIQKFKKWVEGSDKMKHETNCNKRHSVSDHTKDLILYGRKSCSSA